MGGSLPESAKVIPRFELVFSTEARDDSTIESLPTTGQRPALIQDFHELRGTVRYPAQAAPVRSSLSRVRENRTHGLKGVC
jgi:hypothetical protein